MHAQRLAELLRHLSRTIRRSQVLLLLLLRGGAAAAVVCDTAVSGTKSTSHGLTLTGATCCRHAIMRHNRTARVACELLLRYDATNAADLTSSSCWSCFWAIPYLHTAVGVTAAACSAAAAAAGDDLGYADYSCFAFNLLDRGI
jgi:hypothetical protein